MGTALRFFAVVVVALFAAPLALAVIAAAAVILTPFVVVGLAAGMIWGLVRVIKGEPVRPPRRAAASEDAEEAQLMREIHQSLAGMERRIESLETILLDRVTPYR